VLGVFQGIVLKGLVDLFSDRRKGKEQDNEDLIAELYRQIGQLKVDLDWLKKNQDQFLNYMTPAEVSFQIAA